MTGSTPDVGADPSTPEPDRSSHRVASFASVLILLVVFLTPVIGFAWLRGALEREAEWNAIWHTQTMLFRHLARTNGEWPAGWDDLEPDFQPTNKSQRTDSIGTLQRLVNVDFAFDMSQWAGTETDDRPLLITLKSGRSTGDVTKANVQLREHIARRVEQQAVTP